MPAMRRPPLALSPRKRLRRSGSSASSIPRDCAAFGRARDRLRRARTEIATCAISGAVGTFANIDPAVERHVADKMGLVPEPISTQVIPRDRHAMFMATLGVIAGSIENL